MRKTAKKQLHGMLFYCIIAKKKRKEGVSAVKLKKACVLITGQVILSGSAD